MKEEEKEAGEGEKGKRKNFLRKIFDSRREKKEKQKKEEKELFQGLYEILGNEGWLQPDKLYIIEELEEIYREREKERTEGTIEIIPGPEEEEKIEKTKETKKDKERRERKTEEKVWIVALTGIAIVLILFFIVGIWMESVLVQGVAGAFLLLDIIFGIASIKKIEQPEIWVIQRFGKFWGLITEPGLHLIPRIFREIRAIIDGWEQVIDLFEELEELEEEEAYIDFQEGGTAAPQEVAAGIKVVDARKTIYEVKNWRVSTRKLLESAVRNYLNSLTTDEALEFSGANIANIINGRSAKKNPKEDIATVGVTVKKDLDRWGIKLLTLTIKDFKMGSKTAQARIGVMESQKEQESAEFEAEKRSEQTMGTLIYMLANAKGMKASEIREEIKANKDGQYTDILEYAKNMSAEQVKMAAGAYQELNVKAPDALTSLATILKTTFGK